MTDIARTDAPVSAPLPPTPKTVRLHPFGLDGVRTGPVSAIAAAALLAAWFLVSHYRLVPPLFLPSPAEVALQFGALIDGGYSGATLWEHVSASLLRILAASTAAAALGIPLGLAMGLNRWAKGILDVPIEFYWPLPPLAYLPLVIIWLGIGEASKIVLLTLAIFAPICLSAQAGVRALPIERIHAALSLGATRWQIFRAIVLPSALPEILTGVRIGIAVGWSTLVAAELIAATRGIGFMIMSASHFLATDVVFVGIGIIAACAFAFSYAMRLLEMWLVPWKGKS